MALQTAQLSPEERAALVQLVKSPGWLIVMQKIVVPELRQAMQQLVHLNATQQRTDVMRGVVHAFKSLMEPLYYVAELANPLEQSDLALMATLRLYAGKTEDAAPEDAAPGPVSPLPQGVRRRVSTPV